MLPKAWSSIEEVPYCFWRSSVKFQGHTALKIVEFDLDWAFPDCNSSFNSPMATKLSSGYSRLISLWTKGWWCGLSPPQMTTPWCSLQGLLTDNAHKLIQESFVCVAVKRYPRSAALGAHPENIVHGDGIPMTSVAGPVGGLQIWPGTIP